MPISGCQAGCPIIPIVEVIAVLLVDDVGRNHADRRTVSIKISKTAAACSIFIRLATKRRIGRRGMLQLVGRVHRWHNFVREDQSSDDSSEPQHSGGSGGGGCRSLSATYGSEIIVPQPTTQTATWQQVSLRVDLGENEPVHCRRTQPRLAGTRSLAATAAAHCSRSAVRETT